MKLLIDGDWLCYSGAIVFQTENPFSKEGEEKVIMYDDKQAIKTLNGRIRDYKKLLDADEVEFHFSTSRKDNWRKRVCPTYKENRKDSVPPVGLEDLKEYCRVTYEYVEVPTLEADDTLSIAATGVDKGNSIIVSVDKDFLTVPTQIYNPHKNILKKQNRVDAFKFFIYQIIIGDSSDGYKGIPRVGPVGAKKFLAENSKNLYNIWEPLVELGAKKKVDEEYMLQQARLAHLLVDGEFEDGEVILWSPDKMKSMLKG